MSNPKRSKQLARSAKKLSKVVSSTSGRISSSIPILRHHPNSSLSNLANLLAVEAAQAAKDEFLAMLPSSLHDAQSPPNVCVDPDDGDIFWSGDDELQNVVAPFKQEEIVLGPLLGSGEFSHVYEVSSFRLLPEAQDGARSEEEANQRLHMKHVEKFRQSNNARYALKHLKENYLRKNGVDAYVQAAGDLAMEAQFLASLDHPNIIKLRGITHASVAGFVDGPCGYFLIIDRLQETLDQRIKRWLDPSNKDTQAAGARSKKGRRVPRVLKNMSFVSKKSSSTGKDGGEEGVEVLDERIWPSPDELMDEKLNVALQISAAMKYMHSHCVIFRDLKPANVGFDVRGDVKIFDFGLSRTMPEVGNAYNDLYEMSGAGSPRYMAPECLVGEDYNLKADVYTFSIVVWEMLSCKMPYSFVRSREHLVDYVAVEARRPDIDEGWPSMIRGMLESSFDPDTTRRPKMELWYKIIRGTLIDLRGGCKKGLNDTFINRRRTLGSMKDLMDGLDKESFYNELRNSTAW